MKYYIGQLETQDGERTHTCTFKFKTVNDPEKTVEHHAKTWYGESEES